MSYVTWPLLLSPVSSVTRPCTLPFNHIGLEYLHLVSPVVIAHVLFPSPHLHIIHSYSPFCMVHQGTASRKPCQGNIQYTQEWTYYAMQPQSKSLRPSFKPDGHPKASSIQKFWNSLSSRVQLKYHLFKKAFPGHYVLSPSRTDHVTLPVNSHLAPVLLYFNTYDNSI